MLSLMILLTSSPTKEIWFRQVAREKRKMETKSGQFHKGKVAFPSQVCANVWDSFERVLSVSLCLCLSVLSLCSRPVKALSRLSVRLSESIQAKRIIFVRTSSLFVYSMIVR